MTAALSIEAVASQLAALGLRKGGVLVAHISYRAARPIADGPRGLLRALLAALGPAGTLVLPSWTGDDATPFDPSATPVAADLGICAETFRGFPGVLRSGHPFAFAAHGPRAETIVSGPLPLPPHGAASPIGQVHALDGDVLLIGCGHDSNTSLHLAELLAAVPYGVEKTITVRDHGGPRVFRYRENDHCCARFRLADDWLRAQDLQRESRVGYAVSRLMRAKDLVRLACEKLRADPLLFLHDPRAGCAECDAARASIRG